MTKSEVLTALDMKQADLARLLGVSRAAIAQWDMDAEIPEKQQLRLALKFPDLWGDIPKPAKRAA